MDSINDIKKESTVKKTVVSDGTIKTTTALSTKAPSTIVKTEVSTPSQKIALDSQTTDSKEYSQNSKPSQNGSKFALGVMALPLLFLIPFGAAFLGARLGDDDSRSATTIISGDDREERIITEEGRLISDVVSKLEGSVVSITVEENTVGFFGQESVASSAGTGIVVNDDGLILTNRHVIPEGASQINVVTPDGTVYTDVDVIDRDPFNDIAFIQANGETSLVPATLGDSDQVVVGESVVAIGNALGRFNNTVTTGIISGLSRPIIAGDINDSDNLEGLFQTDASINPGNSGGPLLNLNGEVIGINTAVANNAENIGFAIPINDAKNLLESVVETGEIIRPFLGVRYINLNPAINSELGTDLENGAFIQPIDGDATPIIEDSPADKAGLQEGDVIIQINGESITPSISLVTLVSRNQVGDTITLTVVRDGNEIEVPVVLEQIPDSIIN